MVRGYLHPGKNGEGNRKKQVARDISINTDKLRLLRGEQDDVDMNSKSIRKLPVLKKHSKPNRQIKKNALLSKANSGARVVELERRVEGNGKVERRHGGPDDMDIGGDDENSLDGEWGSTSLDEFTTEDDGISDVDMADDSGVGFGRTKLETDPDEIATDLLRRLKTPLENVWDHTSDSIVATFDADVRVLRSLLEEDAIEVAVGLSYIVSSTIESRKATVGKTLVAANKMLKNSVEEEKHQTELIASYNALELRKAELGSNYFANMDAHQKSIQSEFASLHKDYNTSTEKLLTKVADAKSDKESKKQMSKQLKKIFTVGTQL